MTKIKNNALISELNVVLARIYRNSADSQSAHNIFRFLFVAGMPCRALFDMPTMSAHSLAFISR